MIRDELLTAARKAAHAKTTRSESGWDRCEFCTCTVPSVVDAVLRVLADAGLLSAVDFLALVGDSDVAHTWAGGA